MSNKNLVIVPFAYKAGAKTGANLKKRDNPLNIYMYNAVVATVSCMRNNPGGRLSEN